MINVSLVERLSFDLSIYKYIRCFHKALKRAFYEYFDLSIYKYIRCFHKALKRAFYEYFDLSIYKYIRCFHKALKRAFLLVYKYNSPHILGRKMVDFEHFFSICLKDNYKNKLKRRKYALDFGRGLWDACS